MMFRKIVSRVRYRNIVSVFLFLFAGMHAYGQDTNLTVISNTQGAPSSMKMAELKSVLKGERQRWSDGTKVTIFLMKTGTTLGKATCEKVYNMSADRVKRFWLELSFGGKADVPTFCNTPEELESLVSQNAGSIGIIDKSAGTSGTKTVTIEGKSTF